MQDILHLLQETDTPLLLPNMQTTAAMLGLDPEEALIFQELDEYQNPLLASDVPHGMC